MLEKLQGRENAAADAKVACELKYGNTRCRLHALWLQEKPRTQGRTRVRSGALLLRAERHDGQHRPPVHLLPHAALLRTLSRMQCHIETTSG